jgi:hypothetical protein
MNFSINNIKTQQSLNYNIFFLIGFFTGEIAIVIFNYSFELTWKK